MYHPRLVESLVPEWLADSPVVVLTGARQTGKSTLLRHLLPPDRILDLDDLGVLRAFRDRPDLALADALAGIPSGVVALDEVQRVPDLLIAVKREADRGSKHRFLLTGSADLRRLGRVSETLAGRAQYVELMPFAFSEWERRTPGFLPELFARGPESLDATRALPAREWSEVDALRRRLLAHGSMPPLLTRRDASARERWLAGYHRTYLDRDIRDVTTSVEPLLFSRALELAAHRAGGIVSWSALARDLGCSYHTAKRYVEVMRLGFQVFLLPPWAGSPRKRLVKSPRLYWSDVGIRNRVAGTAEPAGAVYENWIVAEVRKLVRALEFPVRLFFLRTHGGLEVDLLLESREGVIAIEVKSRSRVGSADAGALRRLGRDLGDRFLAGLVVHPGRRVLTLGPRIYAVPDVILLR